MVRELKSRLWAFGRRKGGLKPAPNKTRFFLAGLVSEKGSTRAPRLVWSARRQADGAALDLRAAGVLAVPSLGLQNLVVNKDVLAGEHAPAGLTALPEACPPPPAAA